MGHIKEPQGIEFIVDPKPLSAEDKKKISAIIAYYKATGKKKKLEPILKKSKLKSRLKKMSA